MSRRGRCGGMTLIEVVLAAALLGASMTALVVAASRCLAVMRTAKRYQDVQWTLSTGELEHPLIVKTDVDPEDWVVDSTEYENGMTYSREIEEPDEEQKDGLYLVRSRVTWSEKGHEGFEEVVQLVFVKEKAEL